MDTEQLSQLMLEFIETRDGDYDDEWYASPRDFASVILSDFAEYLGFTLTVPPYTRRKTKPEISRSELLKQLLPEVEKLFNIHYAKYMEDHK